MIGVCVMFPSISSAPDAVGPDRELLGAAILARAVATTCPAERDTHVVVAVPESMIATTRDQILPRYGLVEVKETYAIGGSFTETLRQGLELLGDTPDIILAHDGRRPLVSHDLTLRVLDAAAKHGAAALTIEASGGLVQVDDEGLLMPLADRGRVLQSPQAVKRELLERALEGATQSADDLFSLLAAAEIPVAAVDGDRDNLLVVDEADVTRSVEVWSRRAIEFPFLWPRPDRVEEPEASAAEADLAEEVAPSEAMDELLASGGEDEDRAGPLDQAIATLTEQEADGEERVTPDSGDLD